MITYKTRINGREWTCNLVPGNDINLLYQGEFVFGIAHAKTNEIFVSKDLSEANREKTLYHELTHAVIYEHSFGEKESYSEEDVATFVCNYIDTIKMLAVWILNDWERQLKEEAK